MKKSPSAADPSPQCALNSPDVRMPANSPFHGKDDKNYSYAHVNRVSGRTPTHTQPRQKREGMTQPWSNTFLENSNTSWESEWSAPSGTPPMKTEPLSGGFYKNRVNPGHFQSSDWSPSDSSASSSVPSTYGMMHTPQHSPSSSVSASSTSFYEQNGFYNSGYNYGQTSYMHPSYGQQHQQQYQQSVRIGDNAANSYTSSTRNPSNCPPTSMKQPVPDFQRRQMRNGLDMTPKLIKQEPEEYAEMDGENFTSLFTKSLTSLYSQDTENAYSDDTKTYEPDLICDTPSPAPVAEEPTGFQRYHPPSGGQYSSNMTGGYQDARSNFGFYESRNQNCESMPNMMQDLKQEGNQMNTFRYDRPSFDNMHLYASSPNDTKNQAKKRKMSMPNMPPESGYSDKPKKAPRLASFKSDSKWTPNSFAFGDIQIKQEPQDDYNTTELESPVSNKDASSGSNGNSNSKSSSQYADHPKPPPRKRSPGATCFDRFDKKSTPTNKKVSPLSVYAKVQESIVLSVKCRRYKKRTKPITCKEEQSCPDKEEMENYKLTSLTPDLAAHQVMNDMLERVSLFSERSVIDGPDLTQMDALKVKELLMQFCHRYSLDYRDFEDITSVLRPRLIKDKTAKNSERASAIRKRTSISPVQSDSEQPEPVRRAAKNEKGPKKTSSSEDSTPVAGRVLRKLPGRVDRSRPRSRASDKPPVARRRYSTRSAKDVDDSRDSDVDIVIDSSTDRESEAGKEAEVRKKSQRLKKKQPVVEMPARERSAEKSKRNVKHNKREKPRTRSNDKKAEKPSSDESSKTILPKKKWTRLHHMNNKDRSPSVEIVDISKSESDLSNEAFKTEPLSSTTTDKIKTRNKRSVLDSKRNISQKRFSSPTANKKLLTKSKCSKNAIVNDKINDTSPIRKDFSKRKKRNSNSILPSFENINCLKSTKKCALKQESEDSDNEETTSKIKQTQSNAKKVQASQTQSDKKSKLPKANCKKSVSEKIPSDSNSNKSKTSKEKVKKSLSSPELISHSESPSENDNKKSNANESSLKTDSPSDKFPKECSSKKTSKENSEAASKKSFAKDDNLNHSVHKKSRKSLSRQCNEKQTDLTLSGVLNNIKKEVPDVVSNNSRKDDLPSKSELTATNRQNNKTEKSKKQTSTEGNVPNDSKKEDLFAKSTLAVALQDIKSKEIKKENLPKLMNATSFKAENLPANKTTVQDIKVKKEIPDGMNHSNYNKQGGLSAQSVVAPTSPQRETKPAKKVRTLPIKKIPRRRSSSQLSEETELQVVLTKLPDSQVKNGSVSAEVARMCESRERTRVANQQSKGSAPCSDVGKPPELMHIKRHSLAEELNKILKKDRLRENTDPPPPQEVAINLSCEAFAAGKTSEPQDIPTDRYSESEDSDCGLVIDLDRRLSVEERVPSPTFQNSEESDDTVILSKPEESSTFPSSDNQDNAVFMPTRNNCIRSTGRIPTEDACLLLHLSRSAVPPIVNNVTETLPENKPVPLEVKKTEKPPTEPKEQNTETKEPDKDESILRTLLLDNGSSQETSYQPQPGPSMPIPSDSKEEMQFNENLRKLMFQACQLSSNNSSTELDEKRLEQLQTDINANVISEAEEESNDPRVIRDRIQKLRNEILFLQQMANQKDKERVSIMCYKRYKEELLKKLLEKYARSAKKNGQDLMDEQLSSPSDEQTSYDPNHPVASTSSAFTCISSSEDVLPFSPSYQLLRLAYHPTLRTNGPSATITSSDSLEESQCGEVLPPVDTMIANACENYGVDMRTVSRSGSNTSSLTQDVLSNRESMYNSFTAGSSLSSVQIFQTSRESAFSPSHSRSPSLPELSPSGRSTHHFTSSSGSSTSQSPPSLQPEFRPSGGSSFMPITSSFHAHYPLPLVVPSSNIRTESSRLHPASSVSDKPRKETPKHSPKSSPKSRSRGSYSKWTSVHTGRNTSTAMDLHTEHINVQKSTIKQTHSSHSLRIVPPPTTLHSFTKHSVPPQQCDSNSRQQSGHQSRTEVPHENSLRRHIQNIFHRKTAEESRVSSYPPMMNPSDSIIYRGHNNTLSSATVTSDTGGPPRCMSCGYADAKFICSGCRKQWYCSAKCQTNDWPYHSTACFASQYKSSENPNYS